MVTHTALFQLLSDPAGQQRLSALRAGEQPVSALVAQVGVVQSGVSRYLRILHAAGVVQMPAQGRRQLYALRAGPFQALDAWLAE